MTNPEYREYNFTGLPGNTHHYGGLSEGNIASETHRGEASNPREAFKQVIFKSINNLRMGIGEAVVPPQERPHIPTLRKFGFSGTDEQVIQQAASYAPELLKNTGSSAFMWTANAATVAPSCDTLDSKLHVAPANLTAKLHRSLEPKQIRKFFETILKKLIDEDLAEVHEPLPFHPLLGDEGAANHMRFADSYGARGVHLFAYGKNPDGTHDTKKYEPRQSLRASQAVSRLLELDPSMVIFAKQNPRAIDEGVFHNDVIAVNNLLTLMAYEFAWENPDTVIQDIRMKTRGDLHTAMASAKDLSLNDVVNSYVFNSQIVLDSEGRMILIAPFEVRDNDNARRYIDNLLNDVEFPIEKVIFAPLDQSMKNGGGPACLRLRVVLNNEEYHSVSGRIFMDEGLGTELEHWCNKYYRERLTVDDLRDPNLLSENREGLDELTEILDLGSDFYEFQRSSLL